MSEENVLISEEKSLMSEKTKTGLEILQTAVLLGVLGDVLLRGIPWGLNAFLFVTVLSSAIVMLWRKRRPELLTKSNLALHGALVFFGAMFLWRDSWELKAFDFLAIISILGILMLPSLKAVPRLAGFFNYFLGGVCAALSAAFAPIFLVFNDIKWKTIPQTGWTKNLVAVLRGLAIATPILLIFGGLFVAADAVFQGLVENTLHINPDNVVSHVVLFGFLTWITAGYLRGAVIGGFSSNEAQKVVGFAPEESKQPQTLSVTEIKEDEPSAPEEKPQETKKNSWRNFDSSILPNFLTLGAIEISIVLGLINLLFLSFVIVQIPYLFGGFELVQNTPDFKLSEYARRGFGELVTVAALVLPILLVSHWLLRKDSPVSEKIYRVLAGVQIVLLFIIMISAAQRLLILTGNLGYGLTTVRFYPMVVMLWLAIIFGWFALTVLRGAREKFAWGALWSAMVILGVLHFVNPDDFIARTNIRLMNEGRSFDAYYNAELSKDAVPVLLENLAMMTNDDQCVVKSLISHQPPHYLENDFRSWNFSRWKAKKLLNDASLDTSNCPAPKDRSFDAF